MAEPGDEIAPSKYRKKPVVIEAMRWCGTNLKEMIDFTGLHPSANKWSWEEYEAVVRDKGFKIFSLEAAYIVPVGHYVIRGVEGEFYACEPRIFWKTYERDDVAQRAEGAAPEAQALTFFIAQSFADGYFDDDGDQAMKERIRKWLLTEAEKIPDDITIQDVIEKIIGPERSAGPEGKDK